MVRILTWIVWTTLNQYDLIRQASGSSPGYGLMTCAFDRERVPHPVCHETKTVGRPHVSKCTNSTFDSIQGIVADILHSCTNLT
jgi:hypothetical protein